MCWITFLFLFSLTSSSSISSAASSAIKNFKESLSIKRKMSSSIGQAESLDNAFPILLIPILLLHRFLCNAVRVRVWKLIWNLKLPSKITHMEHPFQPTRLRRKKMRCFCVGFFHLKTDHPFRHAKKHLPTLRNGLNKKCWSDFFLELNFFFNSRSDRKKATNNPEWSSTGFCSTFCETSGIGIGHAPLSHNYQLQYNFWNTLNAYIVKTFLSVFLHSPRDGQYR